MSDCVVNRPDLLESSTSFDPEKERRLAIDGERERDGRSEDYRKKIKNGREIKRDNRV